MKVFDRIDAIARFVGFLASFADKSRLTGVNQREEIVEKGNHKIKMCQFL